MPNWTPGPWTYDPIPGYQYAVVIKPRLPGMAQPMLLIASGSDEETHANLKLAAAAPDLYAALLEARNWMEVHIEPTASDHERYNAALDQVGAALRKARGEQPDA